MTTTKPTDTPKQSKALSRSMTVLVILLGGALALIGATQTWVTASEFETAQVNVQLSGQEASPVITAMSMVTIAAGAALSIARNIGRWLIGVITVLAAVMTGWATISVLVNPIAAAAQKVAENTGTTGLGNAADNVDVTLLPWLTIVGAALTLIGALLALTVGSAWPVGKTKKYDAETQKPAAAQPDGQLDEIDTWDELSRGEDPT